MNLMMLGIMVTVMLTIIMMILFNLISKKAINDMQKSSPFECGFNPMSYSRTPFSIHFFMIAVIFLIFDIEIILIFPMITAVKSASLITWMATCSMFTTILIIGLVHEWKNGMLKWTY